MRTRQGPRLILRIVQAANLLAAGSLFVAMCIGAINYHRMDVGLYEDAVQRAKAYDRTPPVRPSAGLPLLGLLVASIVVATAAGMAHVLLEAVTAVFDIADNTEQTFAARSPQPAPQARAPAPPSKIRPGSEEQWAKQVEEDDLKRFRGR